MQCEKQYVLTVGSCDGPGECDVVASHLMNGTIQSFYNMTATIFPCPFNPPFGFLCDGELFITENLAGPFPTPSSGGGTFTLKTGVFGSCTDALKIIVGFSNPEGGTLVVIRDGVEVYSGTGGGVGIEECPSSCDPQIVYSFTYDNPASYAGFSAGVTRHCGN